MALFSALTIFLILALGCAPESVPTSALPSAIKAKEIEAKGCNVNGHVDALTERLFKGRAGTLVWSKISEVNVSLVDRALHIVRRPEMIDEESVDVAISLVGDDVCKWDMCAICDLVDVYQIDSVSRNEVRRCSWSRGSRPVFWDDLLESAPFVRGHDGADSLLDRAHDFRDRIEVFYDERVLIIAETYTGSTFYLFCVNEEDVVLQSVLIDS